MPSSAIGVEPVHLSPAADSLLEMRELAGALGVQLEALRELSRDAGLRSQVQLLEYEQMVKDPIKSRFASDSTFFARIKCDLAARMLARRMPGRQLTDLRVLDVGCGTGTLMRLLESKFGKVRGCDPAAYMVRQAGQRAKLMPSPLEIPFADQSFDVAICACVYHHVDPDSRAAHIREVRRVLAPGGEFLIFEHNPLNPITRLIVRRCPIDAGANLLSARHAVRMLRDAGFANLIRRSYMYVPQRFYDRLSFVEHSLGWLMLGGQYCVVGCRPETEPRP
jgi:ubiquinone/menaquinone biosynthesis C-methylase UbiE